MCLCVCACVSAYMYIFAKSITSPVTFLLKFYANLTDRLIETLASNLESILKVNAYGTKLLARFLQVFRFTCKNLASLSNHLQDSCKFFDSSYKITCKMNRKLAR